MRLYLFEFTIACCLVVGLGSELDLVSCTRISYYFPLSLYRTLSVQCGTVDPSPRVGVPDHLMVAVAYVSGAGQLTDVPACVQQQRCHLLSS